MDLWLFHPNQAPPVSWNGFSCLPITDCPEEIGQAGFSGEHEKALRSPGRLFFALSFFLTKSQEKDNGRMDFVDDCSWSCGNGGEMSARMPGGSQEAETGDVGE